MYGDSINGSGCAVDCRRRNRSFMGAADCGIRHFGWKTGRFAASYGQCHLRVGVRNETDRDTDDGDHGGWSDGVFLHWNPIGAQRRK